MSNEIQPGWPAFRHGLGLFQMVVAGQSVLIYAGRTERDAQRYATIEGARIVFKFQGDVLASGESDWYVAAATTDQMLAWSGAFAAAIAADEADASDPSTFAILAGE